MSATLGSSAAPRDTPRHLKVEFGYCTVTEIGDLYRAMAVRCIESQVTRVLVIVGDGDPAGERALRDSLTMMILAGVADGFRLALVVTGPGAAATYRNAPRDFTAAGIKTRLFDNEEDAARWLNA